LSEPAPGGEENTMPELSIKEAEKLLAGVVIPPRPSVVTAVMEERNRPEPDLRRVAQLIATDVGLSAAVIKTINSPLYGLRRQVSAIDQAVSLLGMKNIASLVMGLALRKAMPSSGLERFWDSAARTALICSHLSKALNLAIREDAYLFGLFHDCAIPLLIQRFPDYKATLGMANKERVKGFTDVEEERHGTNHAVVGSLLASNWHLPDNLRDAIRNHHDPQVFQSSLSSEALNLIALGMIAEYIENSVSRLAQDSEWEKRGSQVLAYLMLDPSEFEDLLRDTREMLADSAA
jgi:HD-like signal output (HDOD) protein